MPWFGRGDAEKGPHGHLAGVPTSPRSQRTRASRRGRHRVSTDSKSIVQNGVPDCVLHNKNPPVPGAPLVRGRTGNSCGMNFHAPRLATPARPAPSFSISGLRKSCRTTTTSPATGRAVCAIRTPGGHRSEPGSVRRPLLQGAKRALPADRCFALERQRGHGYAACSRLSSPRPRRRHGPCCRNLEKRPSPRGPAGGCGVQRSRPPVRLGQVSELEPSAAVHHRRAPRMDRADDLLDIDPL